MNYFSNLFIGRKQNVVQATGYLDTGNTLKDISTGKHVVIASPEIMYDLLPLQLHALVYDYTNGIQPFDGKLVHLYAGGHPPDPLPNDQFGIGSDAGI